MVCDYFLTVSILYSHFSISVCSVVYIRQVGQIFEICSVFLPSVMKFLEYSFLKIVSFESRISLFHYKQSSRKNIFVLNFILIAIKYYESIYKYDRNFKQVTTQLLILTLFSANRDKKDDEKNKQSSAKGTAHTKTVHASSTDITRTIKGHQRTLKIHSLSLLSFLTQIHDDFIRLFDSIKSNI